jgi:thymidylate kinase
MKRSGSTQWDIIMAAESKKLKEILSAFYRIDIPYALVGEDTKALAERVQSDVDIVIRSSDLSNLHTYLLEICSSLRAQLVQVLQHESCAFYYVVSWAEQERRFYLRLDICSDYVRNGKRFLSAEELLEGRQIDATGTFYIPQPHRNFIYYLLKKIDKGSVNQTQFDFLSQLYKAAAKDAGAQVDRFWNVDDASVIRQCIERNDLSLFQAGIPVWQSALRKSVNISFGDRRAEVRRCIERVLKPTGVWIAILGPDGCGKSSVIEALLPRVEPAFRRTRLMHFRPKVGYRGPADNSNSANPHDQPDRSVVGSILKLGYYAADYIIGYFLKVWPARIRSTFLVFDRYYDDLLVDQKRYCYSGPAWLLRCIRPFIPKPDLVFCLDAPAEVLQARKQEVPFDVTARQRDAYKQLVENLENGFVINASQPLDKVVFDVESCVLKYMADRTNQRGLTKPNLK